MAVPFLHADKDQTLSSYSRNHDTFYQCEVFIHLQANVQETIVLLVTELQDVCPHTLHPTKTLRQLVQVQRKHVHGKSASPYFMLFESCHKSSKGIWTKSEMNEKMKQKL